MPAYRFCSEFLAPRGVNVGHPARGGGRSKPDPTVESVRAAIEKNYDLKLLSVTSSNPSFFVCVTVDAADAYRAAEFVQSAVHAALLEVIPGATFVNIESTDQWQTDESADHPHGII